MINTILLATALTFSTYIPVTEYYLGPDTVLGEDSYITHDRCIMKEFTLNEKGIMTVTCEVLTGDEYVYEIGEKRMIEYAD